MWIRTIIAGFGLSAAVCLAQYQVSTAGGFPEEAGAYAPLMAKSGIKVSGPDGVALEIWWRDSLPTGATAKEDNATLTMVPHGAALGILKVTGKYNDRRGQTIKPGVYTMRFSLYPPDGNHQGVAPQRDFVILSRIADDKDPNATIPFDPLMSLSYKASGTPHPLCLSIWKGGAGDNKIAKEGEHDWVLSTKIGDTPIGIILFGVHQE